MKIKTVYLLISVILLLFAVVYFVIGKTGEEIPVNTNPDSVTQQVPAPDSIIATSATDTNLVQLAKDVVNTLHNKDYKAFTKYFNPVTGVRFSPYCYTDTLSDIRMNESQFLNAVNSNKKFLWGSQDGSGDSLFFTLTDYFKNYVYDVDFKKAPQVVLNEFLGFSNTLNNLKEVYPGCNFVEFYFPGFDTKYGGMDWRSLRLVFNLYNGKYSLIGVVHSEWTI